MVNIIVREQDAPTTVSYNKNNYNPLPLQCTTTLTKSEVRSQPTPNPSGGGEIIRSCFCNGDLCPAPKTFRLKRWGFRPIFFDN